MLNVARVRPSNLARSWTWNPFRAQGNRVRGPDPSMCKRALDGLCSGRSPRCTCACSVRRPRSPWHRFARAARSQAGQACLLSAGWHRSSAVAGTVFLVPLGELCACVPSPVCRSRAGLPFRWSLGRGPDRQSQWPGSQPAAPTRAWRHGRAKAIPVRGGSCLGLCGTRELVLRASAWLAPPACAALRFFREAPRPAFQLPRARAPRSGRCPLCRVRGRAVCRAGVGTVIADGWRPARVPPPPRRLLALPSGAALQSALPGS